MQARVARYEVPPDRCDEAVEAFVDSAKEIASMDAISPSAQMKPPSLTILTLFTSPLTGLRSGVMTASAIPLTDRLELLPSTSRSIATRSTAPGSSKVELKISKNE